MGKNADVLRTQRSEHNAPFSSLNRPTAQQLSPTELAMQFFLDGLPLFGDYNDGGHADGGCASGHENGGHKHGSHENGGHTFGGHEIGGHAVGARKMATIERHTVA